MPASNPGIAFKKELVRVLNRLEGDWSYREAAAVIKPVLAGYITPSYLIDMSIMEDLFFEEHRHIYISIQQKLSPLETMDYRIHFFTQPHSISDDLIPYLQVLDMILIFQRREELQHSSVTKRLELVISRLTYDEQKLTIRLARKYPVAVRACLGFFLAGMNQVLLSSKTLQTLSPATLSRYKKEYSRL
ncbi:hypothetical protein U0035_22750 [Niabella yanshanensis]|uniref:Crp/Fnr family transcriptional regulator n=1 Tax=Niabella yanshanensis TaxID=577386 RepID=A0ABZ0W5N7_9BACT|nr:hypothetical protein [Niabella yanshanensis]WQD38496.1 hypothetical protein U0035_22750 [Niabella yanshanensis]